MTNKERDQLIEAAEELKIQRTKENSVRAVVLLQGVERGPGLRMRDRYFIINIPKDVIITAPWDSANRWGARAPLIHYGVFHRGGRAAPLTHATRGGG